MRTLRGIRAVVAGLTITTAALVITTATPASAAPDTTPPTVTITTPANGANYAAGSTLKAKYSCSDAALTTCAGTYGNGASIPTFSLGSHDFTVWAYDASGNKTKKTVTYTIVDKTKPTVSISTPGSGASYVKNSVVNAKFSCKDEPLGSGIASCTGTVADGSPINTSTTGTKSFTVTAIDNAGNKTTSTVSYKVTAT